jgi:O-antigen biosynthesis protein
MVLACGLITGIDITSKALSNYGYRGETLMGFIFRLLIILRREGLAGFISLAIQNLKLNIQYRVEKSSKKRKLRAFTPPNTNQECQIGTIVDRPKTQPHIAGVCIIICVHNALNDVRNCLDSLLEHTTLPYSLILVDDGSDEPTAQYLREFSDSHPAQLMRSEIATGYTCAANRGMRAASAEFVVLLNSDTILTPDWLDLLVACIQSDPKIGIAGPLSNTASWQSVPKIEQGGDWAANPLPDGLSPARFAQLIAASSVKLYIEMPLLNGFCLIIRRKLLDEIGLFDEINFGKGYGEEDDLILRARSYGWKAALADDVYVYHAHSKSYSRDQRNSLSSQAGKILRRKHGYSTISQGVRFCRQNLVLEGIRARSQIAISRDQILTKGSQYSGKSVLFVVPIFNPVDGAYLIRIETQAMHKMGVKVVFFTLETHRNRFGKTYHESSLPTIYGQIEHLELAARNFDAVVATFNPTIAWFKPLLSRLPHPVLGYYMQGFEPWMDAPPSLAYKTALDSYNLIDEMILFCKTDWTRNRVQGTIGHEVQVMGASVDIDLYRPRPRNTPIWPNGPLRIVTFASPISSLFESSIAIELLYQAYRKYKGEVEILLFGEPYNNPEFLALSKTFPIKLFGVLTPGQVANLLSQTDIFIDNTSNQISGLTAMEAMACGCATIVPQFGGASSYALHEQNSLVIDITSFERIWIALQRLIEDEKLRTKLQRNAIYNICTNLPEQAALNMLRGLFKG